MSLTNDQITAKNFKKFYESILPYLNGSAHAGFTPVGTVIAVMGNSAPQNYLACNGQVVNISDYQELAAYFTEQFESVNFFGGDGTTTFGIPDLRGEFLRGTGTNSHTNQGSGANVGVHQDGTVFPRIETGPDYFATSVGGNISNENRDSTSYGNTYGVYTNPSGTASDQILSFTSRPTNTSVLFCIAYKNIFMDGGINYSTEEQIIGTWIDGKPLYQKTINCGALPNNSQLDIILFNDWSKQIVVNYKVISVRPSDNGSHLIPYTGSNSTHNGEMFTYIWGDNGAGASQNTILSIVTTSDRTGCYGYATIQYTKTTD